MRLSLTWTPATFPVLLRVAGQFKPQPFPVVGIVSGAFGIFRGDKSGPDPGAPRFSLVLTGSGGFLCVYRRRIDCQIMAEELEALDVAWTATDPKQITGPGLAMAKTLLRNGQRRYETVKTAPFRVRASPAPVMTRGDPAGTI